VRRSCCASYLGGKEDFVTLTLPTPDQWQRIRRGMTRSQQIGYLADRLRLVNVRQPGWPADMEFCDPQRSVPMGGSIYSHVDHYRGEARLNPMRELTIMRLEPADLQALLPHLACEDYVLAYHAWRPWSPTWHLFQVNELVADLANEAAGVRFVDLRDYYSRDSAARADYISESQKRAAGLHGRWFRALGDFETLGEHSIDVTTGALLVLFGGAWLFWRRKAWHMAIGGAVVLALAGLVTIWFPALQAQRTMLWADRVPIAIVSVAASFWAGWAVPHRKPYAVAGVGLPIAVAWFGYSYGFWGWQTDPQSVAIIAILAGLVVAVPGWWNRLLAVGALVVVGLAFAAPGALVAYAQGFGWMPPPGFEARLEWFHPVVAALIGAGCLSLLQLGWRIKAARRLGSASSGGPYPPAHSGA